MKTRFNKSTYTQTPNKYLYLSVSSTNINIWFGGEIEYATLASQTALSNHCAQWWIYVIRVDLAKLSWTCGW